MGVDMCSDMQRKMAALEALVLPYNRQVTGYGVRRLYVGKQEAQFKVVSGLAQGACS